MPRGDPDLVVLPEGDGDDAGPDNVAVLQDPLALPAREDRVLGVVRDKCFISTGYDFDFGGAMVVAVKVERPPTGPSCEEVASGVETRIVTATASLFTKRRRMRGTAEVDMKTGLVNIIKREEQSL